MVDDLLVVLRHDGVGEGGHLSEQSLVAAFGIELHDEIAALCPYISRVCCGAHQQSHVLWTVGLLVVLDIKLADEAVHVMRLLHVRCDVQMPAHADGEWLVHETHAEEIGLGQVGAHRSVELLGAEQGVDAYRTVEELVMTSDGHPSSAVLQMGLGREVLQVPTAVLYLAHGGAGCQTTATGQEVGAVALRLDVGGYCIDGVLGHEMMHVQTVDADLGIVAHQVDRHLAFLVERDLCRSLHAHATFPLTRHEVGRVSCAVGLQCAVERDAIRYAVVARQLGVNQRCDEIEVLCLGVQTEVGLQPAHVRQVLCLAVEGEVERGGQ